MPPWLAPAISAAAAIGTAAGTARMNKKNRQFSREMYEIQKKDNIEFWQMQNDYNSPQAQMKRFQEAGLNPHLIYGQGNSGNAGSVATPDFKNPDTSNPDWGAAAENGLNAFYDTQIKQATVDNLKRQGTVLDEEALLKSAQTRATEATTNRSVFDLGLETDLRDNSLDFRRTALEQLKQTIDLNLRRDSREAMQNAANLKQAAETLLNMRSGRSLNAAQVAEIRKRIQILEKDGILKDLEIALKRNNASWSDPMWQRFGASLLGRIFGDSDLQGVEKQIDSFPQDAKDHHFGPKH